MTKAEQAKENMTRWTVIREAVRLERKAESLEETACYNTSPEGARKQMALAADLRKQAQKIREAA